MLIHCIKAVRVSRDSFTMNDPGSVSMFFSQTSIYDQHCLFNKTWIIRLRKSCERERRRKRTTLLGISVIVPTHITFLAADSQPWERTLVNQITPPTCPGTRNSAGSLTGTTVPICTRTPTLNDPYYLYGSVSV